MTKLLINEPPLQVLPTLATWVGLNEAMLLQQVHYWISNPKIGKEHEGHKWVRNTIDEWQKDNFPFWSSNTIRRAIANLEQDGLILSTGDLNRAKYDKTKWYTIDYNVLGKLTGPVIRKGGEEPTTQNGQWVEDHQDQKPLPKMGNGVTQNGQSDLPKMGKPIPETTTETTTENATQENFSELDTHFGPKLTPSLPAPTEAQPPRSAQDYLKGVAAALSGFQDDQDLRSANPADAWADSQLADSGWSPRPTKGLNIQATLLAFLAGAFLGGQRFKVPNGDSSRGKWYKDLAAMASEWPPNRVRELSHLAAKEMTQAGMDMPWPGSLMAKMMDLDRKKAGTALPPGMTPELAEHYRRKD